MKGTQETKLLGNAPHTAQKCTSTLEREVQEIQNKNSH